MPAAIHWAWEECMAEQLVVGEVDSVVAVALPLQAGEQKGRDTDDELEGVDLDADFQDDLRFPLRHTEEHIRYWEPFAEETLDSADTLDFADMPGWVHTSGPQLGMVLDTERYTGRC